MMAAKMEFSSITQAMKNALKMVSAPENPFILLSFSAIKHSKVLYTNFNQSKANVFQKQFTALNGVVMNTKSQLVKW